jgi:hypothetical protein
MTASGTPTRSYVKTVTNASACGLRGPAWAAIAAAIATAAAIQTLFISFTSAR